MFTATECVQIIIADTEDSDTLLQMAQTAR